MVAVFWTEWEAWARAAHVWITICWAVIAPVEYAVVGRLFAVASLPVMNVAGTGFRGGGSADIVVDVTVRAAFWLLPVLLPVLLDFRYRDRLSANRSDHGTAEPA
ncbi:MAG: hypothetical protein RLO50_10675 [Azospirillaceae bacterium]